MMIHEMCCMYLIEKCFWMFANESFVMRQMPARLSTEAHLDDINMVCSKTIKLNFICSRKFDASRGVKERFQSEGAHSAMLVWNAHCWLRSCCFPISVVLSASPFSLLTKCGLYRREWTCLLLTEAKEPICFINMMVEGGTVLIRSHFQMNGPWALGVENSRFWILFLHSEKKII